MQTSPAMQALIEQVYHIFRRYPVPQQFVVCCEYCLSQQEQKALRNTSLRAIPYSLINAWNSSPGPDPQNSDEVRYFLPRLLEFVAQGQFDNIHEVFSLRRINLASKENWREDEREYCSDLPASIWLIGYLAMRLSNYSICWKCFPVPISLFRHCLMPSSLYPVTNPQYRWHVCCGITGKRIFRIVVLSRMMTIKPLPPKSMPGPSTINSS